MKRALITAGAAGIGRAMAQGFDAAGYEVWVTDVDADALDQCPAHWHCHHANAADETAVRDVFAPLDHLDVLCANAGIVDRRCGACRLAILCERQSGRGVFGREIRCSLDETSKIRRGCADLFHCGYLWVSKSCALCGGEMGGDWPDENPRDGTGPVWHSCPGAVEGPRMEGVLEREAAAKGMTRDQVYEGYAAGTSMRSFVTAQDIADMAVFLGSDQARMVSGQVIAVDGHTENPDPKL